MESNKVFDEKTIETSGVMDLASADYKVEKNMGTMENVAIPGTILGTIVGVSSDNSYCRTMARRIFERIRYGASTSKELHCINVKCQEGQIDRCISVLCYGKILGGASSIRTGSAIVAQGSFDRRNRFVAKRINVDGAEVEIQREITDYALLMALITIIACVLISNVIGPALNEYKGSITSLFVPFTGGMMGTFKLLRNKLGRIIPFSSKLKIGAVVGGLASVLWMYLLWH